jgi:hypothetical protein
MKKIALSKETLRVLTAQETRHVAGGINSRAQCETAWDQMCLTHYFSCADDCNPSAGCTQPTQGCPPQTQGCTQTQGCATNGCTGTTTGGTTTGTGTGTTTQTV